MHARWAAQWIALLLLAAAPGCGWAPRRVHIPAGGVDVPVRMVDDFPIVPLWINGKGPYPFIVDTGATPGIGIEPSLARELGIRRGPGSVRVGTPTGRDVRVAWARVGRVRLGGAAFEGVPAVILDIGRPDFAGIAGMGLFHRGVLTISFPDRRLSLRHGTLAPGPDTFRVPFVDDRPTVPVTPPGDGVGTLHVLLDTGNNGGLTLPENVRRRLATDPAFRATVSSDTIAGPMTHDLVRLRGRLSMGSYEVADPVVSLGPEAAVGTLPLRHFDVSVDRASKRVRLVLKPPAPATAPATRPATSPATAGTTPKTMPTALPATAGPAR